MTTLLIKGGFAIATGLVAAGTVAGTLTLSAGLLAIPINMTTGLCGFADGITTQTTAGQSLIGGIGMSCLALGGSILYEQSKSIFQFVKAHDGVTAIIKRTILAARTGSFIPTNLGGLAYLTGNGLGTIISMSLSITGVAVAVALLYSGCHCLNKVIRSNDKKD